MECHVKQPEAAKQKQWDIMHQRPSDDIVETRSNAANATRNDEMNAKQHCTANATRRDALTITLAAVSRMLE